jgi:uncharacterized protein YjbI with pentapeptide repeats/membrane protein YdbS with pleckstrin-like domain
MVGVFVAGLVALGIAWVLFVPAAGWLAHFNVGSARGSQLQTARDAAQGRLLTLGAGLFAAGALIFTARNYTLSREGQVTDRYTKAIEQLGSDNLAVRRGGIYALERVARDSAKDHATVMEVLAAFVREQSHKQWPEVDGQSGADVPLRRTRPDVQAAVAVIGRRDPKNDRLAVNLNSAILTGADLIGAQLTGAELNEADLAGAQLNEADLTGAQLNGADLTGAQLNGADLTGARLTRANLTGADLTSALLAHAWLPGADFTRAGLESARLTGANLAGAMLTDANLSFADLTRAILLRANLTSANLSRAYLTGTYLTGAAWPPDAAVPQGWRQDPDSGRLAGGPSLPGDVEERLPPWVVEYLFPTERIVIAARMHPVVVIAPVLLILAGASVAGFVTGALSPGSAGFVGIVWALWAVLAAWQGRHIALWWLRRFVVTDRRMMLVTGGLFRSLEMMPLNKVTDLNVRRSFTGRLLGYGEFIVGSAGQKQALRSVSFVPNPEYRYSEIVVLASPSMAGRDEGDPGT